MIKSIKNFLRQQRESFQLPKSTQNLIPVRSIWPDGIFLSGNGNIYSRTWRISDINYAVASQEDKRTMFLDTSALINAAETGGLLTITIFNRVIDRANMEKEVLHKLQGDDLDRLRVELNAILMEKALENNAIEQVKFVTLSIWKKNIDEARAWLNRSGMDMTAHLAVLGSVATPLDADERLHIFRDLFRPGEEGGFAFDLKATKKKGHSFLDSIAPDSYESLDGNTIKLGER